MYGRSNTCSFDFKSKRIKLAPCPPKAKPKVQNKVEMGKSIKDNMTKSLHIIGSKEFKQEINEEAIVFVLVTKEPSTLLEIT